MKFLGVLLGVGLIFFLLINHKINQLEFASAKLICLKALNPGWTDWDYAFLGGILVREAKEKGFTIERCQRLR
jgi:hypothetical protein